MTGFGRKAAQRRSAPKWFVNAPDTARLQATAEEMAQGRLQSKAGAIVRCEDLPAPIERHHTGSKPGKTVVTLAD